MPRNIDSAREELGLGIIYGFSFAGFDVIIAAKFTSTFSMMRGIGVYK